MPMLGLTMEEGTVAEWLKHEGDAVKKDEPLLTVEMDKGTQEVPSPVAGVLRRIIVQAGTTVPVKAVIAEIGAPGEVEAARNPMAPAPGAAGGSSAAGGVAGSAVLGGVAGSSVPGGVAGSAAAAAGGPGDLPPVDASPADIATASTGSPT